jgi:hypothetical protein
MYVCPTCQHPTLPPAVQPSSYRLCARCGLEFAPALAQDMTDREPQGEAVRLFTPAPAVMPGQLGFGVSRENPGT